MDYDPENETTFLKLFFVMGLVTATEKDTQDTLAVGSHCWAFQKTRVSTPGCWRTPPSVASLVGPFPGHFLLLKYS